ncbi:flagellar biosynthetic protein FliO [Pseudomonas sp. TNT2022 ID1025]|uniref:Flagellar protein n=2 Tax=Pseudomonas rubra TaxID=2942627 RepID=A0ABT5P4F6_9PSED|nr:flagellar biosynthetic protein FliO [Pseudomonas rubra]MDD1013169.1 flagellar biosynthetic protein FliO [Pseudomonas rubra]MDD1036969.1 flagellar biosynthetic protein FliO [Pseudomonas rubra]MDD1154437.1 flagellar biosynthetic protein FliO [Pseudomonas rubra]
MNRLLRNGMTLACGLYVDVALAATQPAAAVVAPAAATGSAAGQLTQLVLGLLLVLGLIFVLAWLLRRLQNAAPCSGQVIEILGTRSLGPRDRLLLIQVGKEQILIGHSPGTIEALHVMAEPIEVPASARQATPEFAQRLLELMGKDQKGRS